MLGCMGVMESCGVHCRTVFPPAWVILFFLFTENVSKSKCDLIILTWWRDDRTEVDSGQSSGLVLVCVQSYRQEHSELQHAATSSSLMNNPEGSDDDPLLYLLTRVYFVQRFPPQGGTDDRKYVLIKAGKLFN